MAFANLDGDFDERIIDGQAGERLQVLDPLQCTFRRQRPLDLSGDGHIKLLQDLRREAEVLVLD